LDPVVLVRQLASTNRTLLLDDWIDRDPRATTPPSYFLGAFIHVLPRDEDVPDPDGAYEENVALSGKLLPDAGPRALSYARPWRALAGIFGKRGDPRAIECSERARAIVVASGGTKK